MQQKEKEFMLCLNRLFGKCMLLNTWVQKHTFNFFINIFFNYLKRNWAVNDVVPHMCYGGYEGKLSKLVVKLMFKRSK